MTAQGKPQKFKPSELRFWRSVKHVGDVTMRGRLNELLDRARFHPITSCRVSCAG